VELGWEGRIVVTEENFAAAKYILIGSQDLQHWVAGVADKIPRPEHYEPHGFRMFTPVGSAPRVPGFAKKFTLTIPNRAVRQALSESRLLRHRSLVIGVEYEGYHRNIVAP